MVSINVLVITYNQQNVIGRALDSILCQREWGLKEIVVCDDHSTDNNWEVIQSYVEKYPDIIKAYRNDPNLGIIRNVEKTFTNRGDADLYVQLSGDDAFCNGYFKAVQQLVESEHIDVQNEAALLCFAYKSIKPNGKERRMSNSCITRTNDLFRLKYRNMVSPRSMLITRKVIECYQPVEDTSNLVEAEELCDLQSFIHADKAYYSSFVGNIYYTRIGISTTMKQNAFYEKYIQKFQKFLTHFDLCEKDIYFTEMKIAQNQYYINPSLPLFWRVIKLFFKSYDRSLGINTTQFLISVREIAKHSF